MLFWSAAIFGSAAMNWSTVNATQAKLILIVGPDRPAARQARRTDQLCYGHCGQGFVNDRFSCRSSWRLSRSSRPGVSAGHSMGCAGHRCRVMVHGGLREVKLELAVQVCRQPAARRVAVNLVDGGPGREERGGPVDERRLGVPLIFLGS